MLVIDFLLIFSVVSLFWMIFGICVMSDLNTGPTHWIVEILIIIILAGPIGVIVSTYIICKEYFRKRKTNKYWDDWVRNNCNVKGKK